VGNQSKSSIPFAVAVVKSLPNDDAPLVEDEDPRVRHTHVPGIGLNPVDGMVLLDPLVQEPESPDHVAALVGQERERDAVLCRERSKDRDRIVAYGEERHALGGENGKHTLQLDELRFTERSPLRAAIEDDEGRATSAGLVQIDHRARLIG
jgi:hypothetical protein